MGVFNEKLWAELEKKVKEEDNKLSADEKYGDAYILGIKEICQYGIDRSKTIQQTFPLYTLHDEIHIVNVIRLMYNLLDDHIKNLTRDEIAMLILSACCHDIGMSYDGDEKDKVRNDNERLISYLEKNEKEYIKAFTSNNETPVLTEEAERNYFRSIHHERAEELLRKYKWPKVLFGKLSCKDLINVCKSHGNGIEFLSKLEPTTTIDLRFCAILLRIADILDFDNKRAPQAIYEYNGFINRNDYESKFNEWAKHLASNGFDFQHIADRNYPYELEYSAHCESMQIEQDIHKYLDWIDSELSGCRKQLECYAGKNREFILPRIIKRNIESIGYLSGEYRLTLDQGQVMDLLVGRDLYDDPAVFVRELLQNAIDAVRTRQVLDKKLPLNWKPQINISSWMDSEGYNWFRIEDNGIGMSEEIIKNFFLKIGCSYYNSDEFLKAKLACKADPDYIPISRFGIGILSCFMGDEKTNLVEISTKHFNENGITYPSLRMKMNGLSGYYYLASNKQYHEPGEMKGRNEAEKQPYLLNAGTVIAVRTNLYQTGKYRGFKEIIDRYVAFPPVPIHYEGNEGSFDYPTENEFIDEINNIKPSSNLEESGLLEFPLSDGQIAIIQNDVPNIVFSEKPVLKLKCVPINSYTESKNLSGAMMLARICGKADDFKLDFCGESIWVSVRFDTYIDEKNNKIGITVSLRFPDDFKEQMKVTGNKRDRLIWNREYEQLIKKLFNKYKSDSLKHQILRAISDRYSDGATWKNEIKYRFGISSETLNEKIKQLEEEYYKVFSLTYNEIEKFKKYNDIVKEWNFILCDLNKYEWYKKFFISYNNPVQPKNIVVHNGIYCGSSEFFNHNWYRSKKMGTVLLLKDKYRPKVDISRDKIRQLPLEAACDLEIIREQLKLQGFGFEGKTENLDEANYTYISADKYIKVLDERPDFIDRLYFNTNKGIFTAKELDEKIERKEPLIFTRYPRLGNNYYRTSNEYLYNFLSAAYLVNKYTLKLNISNYDSDIIIEKGKKDNKNIFKFFSPTFFLETTEKTEYLTCRSAYGRTAINANHKLSKFLIENAEKLHSKVPGIFFEILHCLADDDLKEVITRVNDLLQRIRSLPDINISVPQNLELSESDFF